MTDDCDSLITANLRPWRNERKKSASCTAEIFLHVIMFLSLSTDKQRDENDASLTIATIKRAEKIQNDTKHGEKSLAFQ